MQSTKADQAIHDTPVDENGCRLRNRSRTWDGYTMIYENKSSFRLHVYVLEKKLGRKLLPKMNALHTCDNRNCVAEDHLYEGTHSQNMKDMFTRNRHLKQNFLTSGAILEARHVIAIRRIYTRNVCTLKQLSQVFGVAPTTINDIVYNMTWKDLELTADRRRP